MAKQSVLSWSLQVVVWLLPTALALALALAVAATAGWSVEPLGLVVLAAGVLTTYSGDRWRDRRLPMPRVVRALLACLVVVGTLAVVAVSSGRAQPRWDVLLVLVGISVAYPLARRVPLGKTLAVVLAWAVAVCCLPQVDGGWRGLAHPVAWLVAALVAAGTLLYDWKDLLADEREPGVLQRWGPRGLRICAGGAVLVAAALIVWRGWWWWWGPAALGLGLLVAWPRPCRHRLAGPALVDGILMLPALGCLA